jgi:putative ABC transport system ATP-binding protein
VAIARALITEPKLILADEPTGALDPITSREVLELFAKLHREEDVAFFLVTHNREVAAFCERSLELRDGRFVAQHGTDVDIADLSGSRELIIDDTGTVTLPPDVLAKIGGPGRFELPDIARDSLNLERVDSERLDVDGKTGLILAETCPACLHVYGESEEQRCPDCGSSRPMVQA